VTHTYAVLEVSDAAHDEIRKLLEDAGYRDQLHEEDGRLLIDMHGIALAKRVAPEEEPRCVVQREGPYEARSMQDGVARRRMPYGTVARSEGLTAYEAYAKRHGVGQSFERLLERGGFGYWELTDLLGHEPRTWRERT
jgi:hypothetical protein